jgi:hypothetical protein
VWVLEDSPEFLHTSFAGGIIVSRRFVTVVSAICLLLFLFACKSKESSNSQEKTSGVPAAPAQNTAKSTGTATNTADNNGTAQGTPAADANGAAAAGGNTADANNAAPPEPIVVPVGTKLTIKLTEQLGSKDSQPGQSFSATLDKDVVINGQTAISAGANVAGSVVTAHSYGSLHGEASLVLKLTSVNINNADQNVVTETRSFGPKIQGKSKVGKFFKGLAKRAEGDEKEVTLASDTSYTFTLKKALTIPVSQ